MTLADPPDREEQEENAQTIVQVGWVGLALTSTIAYAQTQLPSCSSLFSSTIRFQCPTMHTRLCTPEHASTNFCLTVSNLVTRLPAIDDTKEKQTGAPQNTATPPITPSNFRKKQMREPDTYP